jgi:hypothetical protein
MVTLSMGIECQYTKCHYVVSHSEFHYAERNMLCVLDH